MSSPRGVARELKATAAKVARVPAAVATDAARTAVDTADQLGGRMKNGERLTADIGRVRSARSTTEVTVEGDPPGAWSIKSYGRRGNYTVRTGRVLDLRGAGGGAPSAARSAHIKRAATGDGRWDRVIDAAAEQAARALDTEMKAALDG